MKGFVTIDILVPVLNESEYILNCLDSITRFKKPDDAIVNIIVVDGMSEDDTLEKIERFKENHSNIRILKNTNRIQSSALNIGIKASKANYIMRIDAHSIYPDDYLINCIETIRRTNADNVGGIAITESADDSLNAILVQAITTSIFGVGNSGFRIGANEGPADTVPYGFFRRASFDNFGLFDERLARAQDFELNSRIKKLGGIIWLNPKIYFRYFNQKSLFRFLKKQFILEAPYNAYMWYLAPYTFNFRHSITLFFSIGFIGGNVLLFFWPLFFLNYLFVGIMIIYLTLSIYFARIQAKKYRVFLLYVLLPIGFFLFHLVHGLGIIQGIFQLIFRTAPIIRSNKLSDDT